MHCERVFAILTRGPFPSGDVTDVAVELHLAHCLECRRLAEALRPLDETRNTTQSESIAAERAKSLPGYRGDHVEWSAGGSIETRIAPSNRRRTSISRESFGGPSLSASRFAAAIVLGIVIGTAWCTINIPQPASERRSSVAVASMGGFDASTESRVQAQLISTMALSPACRKDDLQIFVPMTRDSGLHLIENKLAIVNQCCTQCHAAGRTPLLNNTAREIVIHSCNICHAR